MKAIIEFNFTEDSEDDIRDLNAMLHARELSLVIWDIDQYLRSRLKYEDLNNDQYEALDSTREELWEIINNYGVNKIINE